MADFDFSTLITDRAPADLEALRDLLATPLADWTAEQLAEFNRAASKGAYNYTDLNRVTACMDYLNERLTALGYVTGYHPIIVHPATPPEPVGPLPDGYTQLEYIESTGTQYIDTGIYPGSQTKTIAECDLISGVYPTAFGAWTDSGSGKYILLSLSSTSLRGYFGTSEMDANTNILGKHTLVMDRNIIYVDGNLCLTLPSSQFTCAKTLYLFTFHGGESMGNFNTAAKYYACQVFDNEVMVRDYVPCRSPNNVVGLYDLVDGEFYPNAGAGVFSAGPEVINPQPDPELDPYTWYEEDTLTATQMQRYLVNVAALRGVLAQPEDTVDLPTDMTGLTQAEANAIEGVLGIIEGEIQNMAAAWFYAGDLYAGEV